MSVSAVMNHAREQRNESLKRLTSCFRAGSDLLVTEQLVSVFNHSFGCGRELLITAAARERERESALLILQTRYKIYLQQTGIVFGQRFFSQLKFLRLCAENQ